MMKKMDMSMLLCLLWMCFVSPSVLASSITEEHSYNGTEHMLSPHQCIYDKIMRGYNKYVVPVHTPEQQLNMTMQFVLRSLAEIVEKEEVMRLLGYLRTSWFDFRLVWDPAECKGVNETKIPAELVWTPDFVISNSVNDFHQYTFKRDFSLFIRYDGYVYYSFGGMFPVSCFLDLTLYPFDKHNCSLIMESWVLNAKELSLTVLEPTFDTQSLDRDAIWDLKGMAANYYEVAVGWPAASTSFLWQRKVAYPVYNLICPTILIIIITLGVFWLPADCGEKISLAVTVLLAFSVIQLLIFDILPENSDSIPNLSVVVIGVMALATFSVLSSMMIVYVTYKPATSPVPKLLRKLLYSQFTSILGLRSELPYEVYTELDDSDKIALTQKAMTAYKVRTENEQIVDVISTLKKYNQAARINLTKRGKDNSSTSNVSTHDLRLTEMTLSTLEEILAHVKAFMKKRNEEAKDDDVTTEWRVFGKVLDRIFFTLCVILLLTCVLATYLDN